MIRAPAVSVRGLSVRYGGVRALHDVSAGFAAGRIAAIVGPSGCGKSTFLACLNRLTDLIEGCRVEGSVVIGGRDVLGADADPVALRRRVGMIFQKPNPFPLPIRENVQLALREHGVRDRDRLEAATERALSDVGLLDEVADRLQSSALGLSGGQQQRLCIARALALEPDVLLLDEPCSSLDPAATAVIEDLLRELAGRYTVLVVTHDLAQARRIADDVAVFWPEDGAGRLVEQGSAERMFTAARHPAAAAYLSGGIVADGPPRVAGADPPSGA